jgi:transcriptional regulator with XRE-family HTH domain
MIDHDISDEKGILLHRFRMALGWDAAKVAALLGVSSRTIGLWETSVQPMPDARWRLFIHEVVNEANRDPELVVITADDQLIAIDVVSNSNYAGYVVSDDGKTALIASYTIDRQTNQPKLHRQRFLVSINRHVIDAADRWERARQIPDEHRTAFEMQSWITRRALKGELSNPRLTGLKEAINKAKFAVDEAANASDNVREERIRAFDEAVALLIKEVSAGDSKLS